MRNQFMLSELRNRIEDLPIGKNYLPNGKFFIKTEDNTIKYFGTETTVDLFLQRLSDDVFEEWYDEVITAIYQIQPVIFIDQWKKEVLRRVHNDLDLSFDDEVWTENILCNTAENS